MKKFVSMAMVAAMTTSMVPATAFAGAGSVSATAKIVDAWTMTKDFTGEVSEDNLDLTNKSVPELQIKITETNYKNSRVESPEAEVTVSLDNAELHPNFSIDNNIGIRLDKDATGSKTEVDQANTAITDALEDLYGIGGTEEDPVAGSALADLLEATTDLMDAEQALEDAKVAAKAELAGEANATLALDLEVAKADMDAAKVATEDAQQAVEDAFDAVEAAKEDEAEADDAMVAALEAWNALGGEAGYATDADAAAKKAWAEAKVDYLNEKVDYEGGETKYELNGSEDDAVATADDDAVAVAAATKTTTAAATAGALEDYKEAKDDLTAALAAYTPAADEDSEPTGTTVEAYNTALAALDAVEVDEEDIMAHEDVVAALEDLYGEGGTEEEPKDGSLQKAFDDAFDDYSAKLDAYDAAVKEYEKVSGGQISFARVDGAPQNLKAKVVSTGEDEFTFKIIGELHEGDVIYIDLETVMDKTSVGRQATLDVESDDLNLDVADLVYVGVEDYGITATTKKLATVAEDEEATLAKDLKIESVVGNFQVNQTIELKLNNGFEFKKAWEGFTGTDYTVVKVDGDKAIIEVDNEVDEITIKAEELTVVADSAKSGDVATITVKATSFDRNGNKVDKAFKATAKVEVAKVVDYTVIMSVDADEDVPVIYSGVNVDNAYITDDSDHYALEVTVEESFPGAWSMRKGFNFELPDGVYVTDVNVIEAENFSQTGAGAIADNKDAWEAAFKTAYQEGDHKNFEFAKRTFDDVNTQLAGDEASMTFELQLVADPTFHGDVTLKFTGDLVDEQEVTIAKFQPIAVVKAEQNDLKIDYRYTEVPTAVTVTETAAGLWKEGSEFWMAFDKDHVIEFEDGATFEATNGMEIDDFEEEKEIKSADAKVNSIGFAVEEESDEAATVTISNLSLFMNRNIPAGAYDLVAGNSAAKAYLAQSLFAPDTHTTAAAHDAAKCDDECIIADVEDFSDVVKEAFVNVVTAGREQDDASFTTKVVVPVGESYIVAGEAQVNLDVPAYVSAAGYTMLPVRAVATALGINNNNVIWNGETKTVTILYGQRIITMVAGQKTVNVNGSVIPASAAVEIVDGRTFLPMRDLATALGVTDITWDAATKTATLNGNA